jgi:anti-sigma B factor antagonist
MRSGRRCGRRSGTAPRTKVIERGNKEIKFMEMVVEEIDGGVTSVILRGRLDTAGADSIDLKFNAVAGAKRAVVVDLSNVNLLTSLGIRVLLLGARAVKNKGGKLVILSPDANVRAVLTTARTDTLIPIFDDRSAAIAAVSASAG